MSFRSLTEIEDSADSPGEIEIVCHDDQGDAVFFLDFEEKVGDFAAGLAIECSGGLVGEDDAGLVD